MTPARRAAFVIAVTSAALAACRKTDDREAIARAKAQEERERAALVQKLRDENAKLAAEMEENRRAQEAAWKDAGRTPPPCPCDAGDPLCSCLSFPRLPEDLPRAH